MIIKMKDKLINILFGIGYFISYGLVVYFCITSRFIPAIIASVVSLVLLTFASKAFDRLLLGE